MLTSSTIVPAQCQIMKVISVNITTGHYDLDLISLKFTAGKNPSNKRNLTSQQIVCANKNSEIRL